MKYITKYIYLLIIINLIFSSNVWDNKLLFCLKKNIDPVEESMPEQNRKKLAMLEWFC